MGIRPDGISWFQGGTGGRIVGGVFIPDIACGTLGSAAFLWGNNSLVGPFWQSGTPGTFFVIGINPSNLKQLQAWGSTNFGKTWATFDTFTALTNNIVSFEARQAGADILVAVQEGTTGRVSYSRFNLGTQTWAILNKQVIASVSAAITAVGNNWTVSIDKRTGGRIGILYKAADETVGTPFSRMGYKETSDDGTTFSAQINVGNYGTAIFDIMGRLVASKNAAFDSIHVFFYNTNTVGGVFSTGNAQTLSTANALSAILNWTGSGNYADQPQDCMGRCSAVSGVSTIACPNTNGFTTTQVSEFTDSATAISGPSSVSLPGAPQICRADTETCQYPMACVDYFSGSTYGIIAQYDDNTVAYNFLQTGGPSSLTPVATAVSQGGSIAPNWGLASATVQKLNGIIITIGSQLYVATIFALNDTGSEGFQFSKQSSLPELTTVASWTAT